MKTVFVELQLVPRVRIIIYTFFFRFFKYFFLLLSFVFLFLSLLVISFLYMLQCTKNIGDRTEKKYRNKLNNSLFYQMFKIITLVIYTQSHSFSPFLEGFSVFFFIYRIHELAHSIV